MNEIKLLDCTLRDGGYVNDWEFGNSNIINIFERLVSANIDIIEIGFLDQRRLLDIDRTIMPDCRAINTIFSGMEKGKALIVGMIDYGTCDIEHLLPKADCFLDGIRVIFKKEIKEQGIAFCSKVKKLGYKVFVQAVSITSYSDEEMMDLVGLVNELEPYAFSVVDTYGLLHKQKLMHYIKLADEHLRESIGIGYHSHNNFQLAYANCVELLENPPKKRMLLVDGTLYGIGKSAGNAPIELLAMFMNDHLKKNYLLGQLLEAIDVTILEIFQKVPWGYCFKFFIAASHDCHPNYVSYLMDKKTLSVNSVNDILSTITHEKKLLYDKAYIEKLYLDYQKEDCNDLDDFALLQSTFKQQNILLLGPGNTISTDKDNILRYIDDKKPVLISVNFLPDYPVDFIFISNSRRYVQLSSRLRDLDKKIKIIATSNVTKTKGTFDFVLEYSSLLDEAAQFVDNPMIMLLKMLDRCEAKHISLAGFDGYTTARTSDYVNPNMEYSFSKTKAIELNNDAIGSLARLKNKVPYTFITKTFYVDLLVK